MKGFVVYPTYKIKENKAYVHLYGRLENGEPFVTISYFEPYFFIRESDAAKARGIKVLSPLRIEESDFRNFSGEKLSKVILDVPPHVPEIRDRYQKEGIACYEADIRFAYRFMIDHGIKGALEIDGESRNEGGLIVYENPRISPAAYKPELKIVSIDIETDMGAKEVYSISLYCPGYKKSMIVTDKHLEECETYPDEKSLLGAFIRRIAELDPDIIIGWNLIDFDLSVLKRRCESQKIPFAIGRGDSPVRIKPRESFFRESTIDIPGRVAIDGIHLLKMSMTKLDDYKLQTAAKAILGESKLDIFDDYNKGKEIERIFREDPLLLAKYNLKDSELVYSILCGKGYIDIVIQRSLLTGMQPDRVKASIASLDNLYIREAREQGYICNTANFKDNESRIKGGYVKDSIPGIYDYIIVLDFKSLYPSIIRTFNIDPLSYVPQDKEKENERYIQAPNGAKFRTASGILPWLIQRLWEQRDDAKRRGNKEESYAVKITMNSFFGVLANPTCRFYNLNVANAITYFGQYIVKTTAELVEKEGYRVIYGDTDSIFVETKADGTGQSEKIGNEIQEHVNSYWKNFVNETYSRQSFLEIQFEKVFVKFIMPKIRGSERGSKKRYAGLQIRNNKEVLTFTGLEFVRRDWTDLAKKFQLELLDRVFHNKEVVAYITEFVNDLKKGKYDDLIVYKKALRKDIERYTKTTPPHVKAARMIDDLKSDIIFYIMTKDGPQPVEKLKSPIDYSHYIEKQVKPIADSILSFYNKNFDDILKGSTQKSLFSY